MVKVKVTVMNDVGLHARPASVFVQAANKYESRILIRNLNNESPAVNAKSILHVLTLGVCQGNEVEITTEGKDEVQAAKALKDLIYTDFTVLPGN